MRIGMVGCGGIARRYHGPSYVRYAEQNSDVALVACCDTNETSARQFAEAYGFSRHYTDYQAMLDTEALDAVCLCVPEPLMCTIACHVMQRGLPTFIEKPPGLTTDELGQMIQTARVHQVLHQVAFNRRHMPLAQALKQRLTQHDSLQHIRYEMTRVNRQDADFSTTAIHGIDTTRFLAGSDYQSVRFHYQPVVPDVPHVVNIYMDCVFASGTTAHLAFTPMSGAVTERATVHLQDHSYYLKMAVWDSIDLPGTLQNVEKGQVIESVTGEDEDYIAYGFYDENLAFFESVRSGIQTTDTLESARQAVAIMQAIRERKPEYTI